MISEISWNPKSTMKLKLKLVTRLFLSATPLITGSVFVASPSFAASESCAATSVNFSLFSHNPFSTFTGTDTKTTTVATDGASIAVANADATFAINPDASQTTAYNTAESKTKGDGNSYLGLGESSAALLGYKFLVGAGETFSFNFKAFLGLGTSVDNPSAESANSLGAIAFQLFEETDSASILLDSFALIGNVTSLGDTDFIDEQHSSNVSFNHSDISSSFGGAQESAEASIFGQYSRTFATPTYVTLFETKTTQAFVSTFDFLK